MNASLVERYRFRDGRRCVYPDRQLAAGTTLGGQSLPRCAVTDSRPLRDGLLPGACRIRLKLLLEFDAIRVFDGFGFSFGKSLLPVGFALGGSLYSVNAEVGAIEFFFSIKSKTDC